MEISLDAVAAAARRRLAAITAEGAGYLTLLVVKELGAGARRVPMDAVALTEAGEVKVMASSACDAAEAEGDCRRLLGELSDLAQSTTPALRAASERPSTGNLEALGAELHSALIPINHAAARRALARLYREARRAGAMVAETVASTPRREAATVPQPSPGEAREGARDEAPAPALMADASSGVASDAPHLAVGAPVEDVEPLDIEISVGSIAPPPCEAIEAGALDIEVQVSDSLPPAPPDASGDDGPVSRLAAPASAPPPATELPPAATEPVSPARVAELSPAATEPIAPPAATEPIAPPAATEAVQLDLFAAAGASQTVDPPGPAAREQVVAASMAEETSDVDEEAAIETVPVPSSPVAVAVAQRELTAAGSLRATRPESLEASSEVLSAAVAPSAPEAPATPKTLETAAPGSTPASLTPAPDPLESAAPESVLLTPTPDPLESDRPNTGRCSDLSELVSTFLSHTDSDDRISRDLRRLVGLGGAARPPPGDAGNRVPR